MSTQEAQALVRAEREKRKGRPEDVTPHGWNAPGHKPHQAMRDYDSPLLRPDALRIPPLF